MGASCVDQVSPICDIVKEMVQPGLFIGSVAKVECELLHLPTKLGGMGIWDAVKMTSKAFVLFEEGSGQIVKALINRKGVKFNCPSK